MILKYAQVAMTLLESKIAYPCFILIVTCNPSGPGLSQINVMPSME